MRDMLEDFRLKVFMSVAETGSFTKAAKALGISQPAVSQNVITLEKETGITLFVRARGEAALTAGGMAFKEYAAKILYWYSAASDMFGKEGKMTSARPVRIAADPVISEFLLPPALSVLSGTHPELSFHILNRPENHSATMEADVEITVSPNPGTMDFAGERNLIGVMDAVVVASPGNRSLADAAVHEGDDSRLMPFSTIAGIPVTNRFAVWSGYSRFFTPDLTARTALVSDSMETIKSMVSASVALAGILPAMAVRKEISSGGLLQMPVLLPDFAFDIHFNPQPEFAGKAICRLLRNILENNS